MIGTILWALVAGVILGYLGKLLLPGRQNIPAWATIGAGIVAALLGGLIADWLGVGETAGIDWWRHIIQVIFAVLAIWAVASMYARRGARRPPAVGLGHVALGTFELPAPGGVVWTAESSARGTRKRASREDGASIGPVPRASVASAGY